MQNHQKHLFDGFFKFAYINILLLLIYLCGMTKKRTFVFRQSYYKVTHIITSTPKPLIYISFYIPAYRTLHCTYITISNFPAHQSPLPSQKEMAATVFLSFQLKLSNSGILLATLSPFKVIAMTTKSPIVISIKYTIQFTHTTFIL